MGHNRRVRASPPAHHSPARTRTDQDVTPHDQAPNRTAESAQVVHTAYILAWVAAGLGLLHAAISVYWGLGGTWLLDTIGGALEAGGRSGDPLLRVLVWVAVGLKLSAVIAGILAVLPNRRGRARWLARLVAWTAAIILTLYGGVLTIAGLLVQTGIIPAAPDADHRALAWHAFFWDPWFLLWGLVLGGALWRSRA